MIGVLTELHESFVLAPEQCGGSLMSDRYSQVTRRLYAVTNLTM